MNSRHGDGQSHARLPPALQVAHAIAELKLVRRRKSLVDMIPLRLVGDYGIMNGNNHGIFMGRIPENVNGIYYTIIIDEWEYNWKLCYHPISLW